MAPAIREIPVQERLITIEDAPELILKDHPNHVRLFYSKGDQGQARCQGNGAPEGGYSRYTFHRNTS